MERQGLLTPNSRGLSHDGVTLSIWTFRLSISLFPSWELRVTGLAVHPVCSACAQSSETGKQRSEKGLFSRSKSNHMSEEVCGEKSRPHQLLPLFKVPLREGGRDQLAEMGSAVMGELMFASSLSASS